MAEIDKDKLYGKYQEGEDKKRNLFLKTAHKALDIPQDDMNISPTTVTTTGIGWKELLVMAARGLGGYGISQMNNITTVAPQTASPADSEYQVLFYDKDGNQIEVPRKPQ